MDFFASELGNVPILRMVDLYTEMSATAFYMTREMSEAAKTFEMNWVNVHGPSELVSADIAFMKKPFLNALRNFGTSFEPRPARRHNKLGVVDRKNAVVRLLVQRLMKDARYLAEQRGTSTNANEVLARATYLSNILYRGKTLSSFQLARGYTQRISFPKEQVSEELLKAHEEQVARRALAVFQRSRSTKLDRERYWIREDEVYFLRRSEVKNRGTWETGFVRRAEPQFCISTRADHKGQPIRAAYEDVRRVPKVPFLRELDQVEYLSPRSFSLLDEEGEYEKDPAVELPPIFAEAEEALTKHAPDEDDEALQSAVPAVGASDVTSKDHIRLYNVDIVERITPRRKDVVDELENVEEVASMFDDKSEANLWSTHPSPILSFVWSNLFCLTAQR